MEAGRTDIGSSGVPPSISAQVLMDILDVLSEPVVLVSPEARLLFANKAFGEFLGIPADELVGTPFQEHIRAEDPVPVLGPSESHRVTLSRYVRRDGEERWGEAHCLTITNGQSVGFHVISVLDVTERHRATDSQREGEILWSDMFSRSTDAVVIYVAIEGGADFRVRDLNPACERIERVNGEEVVGRSAQEAFPHLGSSGMLEVMRRVWSTGAPERREVMRREADSISGWWVHTVTKVAGNYLVDIYEDVTERKRAEEGLRQLTKDLERRVQERTLQLEMINRELEAFSYSVSHDLRAPLRHLSAYSELLLSRCGGELNDTARRYVDVIADSARQMGVLIDDLLQFSRIGRTELRLTEVDMRSLVEEVVESLSDAIGARSVEWTIADLPAVRGDRALLKQVWANLLDNAVKYTRPRAMAQIEVGFERSEHEVTYYVRDNGVGFDMQYVDKLFGVFQRLHRPEEFEGTGIGLANVSRIVTRLGGQVWAEAQLDKGATFYFSLPR